MPKAHDPFQYGDSPRNDGSRISDVVVTILQNENVQFIAIRVWLPGVVVFLGPSIAQAIEGRINLNLPTKSFD